MTMIRSCLPLALMGLAVTRCATVELPPASLIYANASCDAAPNLSNAISLTPEKEKAVHLVSAPVTTETPCIMRNGKPLPYVVFALPEEFADKTLVVGSALETNRIFAPHIEILDAQGTFARTFEREEYFYRGPVYSIQFRPRETERYLLVTAEPEMVGVEYNSIHIGVNSNYVATAYGGVMINTGSDTTLLRTFSYDGTLSVMINDTDTSKKN